MRYVPLLISEEVKIDETYRDGACEEEKPYLHRVWVCGVAKVPFEKAYELKAYEPKA